METVARVEALAVKLRRKRKELLELILTEAMEKEPPLA